jgi:hypothetical protein
MKGAYGGILKPALGDCKCGFSGEHVGRGTGVGIDGAGRRGFLFMGLLKRRFGVVLGDLGLVKLLARHIALGGKWTEAFDGTLRKFQICLGALGLLLGNNGSRHLR